MYATFTIGIEAAKDVSSVNKLQVVIVGSGVAGWGLQNKEEYFTKLWMPSLVHDLLWFSTFHHPRATEWRAPTFSWGSLAFSRRLHELNNSAGFYHHIISYNRCSSYVTAYTEVVEAQCSSTGLDRTGNITSAHLMLACKEITATLHYQFAPNQMMSPPGVKLLVDELYLFRYTNSILSVGRRWLPNSSQVGRGCTLYVLPPSYS